MKRNAFLILVACLLAAAPARAQLQRLPSSVTTLVFDDSKAVIIPDTVSAYEAVEQDKGSAVEVRGDEMLFAHHNYTVRIHLCPGTVQRLVVKGCSDLSLEGNFRFPGTFELCAGDASKVAFKNLGDTLYADRMVITLRDASRLIARNCIRANYCDFTANDYALLKAFRVEPTGSKEEGFQSQFKSNGHASCRILHNRFPGIEDDIEPDEEEGFFDTDEDEVDFDELFDFESDSFDNLLRRLKLRSIKRHNWLSNMDFAWGFHNWSESPLGDFMGLADDAAVRTSFNHILLTFNYPVLYSRHVALYAGLGLEWDKYKFHHGDIHFDQTVAPYHFANGPVSNSESRLLMRYVVMPIAVKFNLGGHWRMELAAIHGLHWGGSHTGLRRDINNNDCESNIRDFSVNKYFLPYKLDARVAVQCCSVGVYFQASLLSAFRDNCQELFPVKFGIIL